MVLPLPEMVLPFPELSVPSPPSPELSVPLPEMVLPSPVLVMVLMVLPLDAMNVATSRRRLHVGDNTVCSDSLLYRLCSSSLVGLAYRELGVVWRARAEDARDLRDELLRRHHAMAGGLEGRELERPCGRECGGGEGFK